MSPAELESLTIPALLAATAARQGDQQALGSIRDGNLTWLSWNDFSAEVDHWRARLNALGVQPGERVAQLSPNDIGWIFADLAIQTLGAVHVPLHAALAAGQVAQQVTHAGATLLIVDTPETRERVSRHLPATVAVSTFEEFYKAQESEPNKGVPA
jgi:long-subunit acyl-CoA synthetase (AMP-forming)